MMRQLIKKWLLANWLLLLLISLASYAARQDPTQPVPYVVQTTQTNKPLLQAIIVSSDTGRKLAIINNRSFQVGNTVGRAIIVDIQPDFVQFKKNGKVFKVYVLGKDIKQTVPDEKQADNP